MKLAVFSLLQRGYPVQALKDTVDHVAELYHDAQANVGEPS